MSPAARWSGLFALVALVVVAGGVMAAEPPAAPKVSAFAPAEDLVNQVDYYVERLEKYVDSADAFKEADDKVLKDASTLAVIALSLGLHDKENKYQKAAPDLIKAAQKVAAAKDLAAAKAGVAAVKEALGSKGDPSALKWEKVAALKPLMQHVSPVNQRLKRYLKGPRFKSMAKDTAGDSAALAAISQASVVLLSETTKPDEGAKWFQYCGDMRDAAAAVNAAIKAQDQKAADKAMKQMTKACDDCHAVFSPDAASKTE